MFPEDASVNMKMLIQLATGSQLIPDGESRILAMVHYLKISSLLLDSGKEKETKVHDIIRDVARSIAFTDSKYAFLQVICNSGYLPSNANYHTRKFLRIDAETDDVHFYEDLVCPNLHTLWLHSNDHLQQFSGGFFSMFMNLSFLMLQEVNISLEQFSLQPLGNLGTLSLINCDISRTDVSLFPKHLKSLWIYYCKLPRPLDVANLIYLRKLEIRQWAPITVMVNVISSLSSLEELHIPKGFKIDSEEYHLEPIVMEISRLTHLTSLYFGFYNNDNDTFRGTNIFSNIDRYNIFAGAPQDFSLQDSDSSATRSIMVCGNHSQSWDGLMARAEEVLLWYSDVDVSSICTGHKRAFVDLKKLNIFGCGNMGHLASKLHDEIQYSLQPATSFSKLTILEIVDCSTLKYLFCNNIANSLVQLQYLDVGGCDSMETIIMNEDTSDGEIINFSKLKSLTLTGMQRLASFNAEQKYMHSGSTSSMEPSAPYQSFFDRMVAFPSLEYLNITRLSYTSVIWGKECYNDTLSSFCKLIHLSVLFCDKLEVVIPQAMLHRLNNLECIKVHKCNSLRTMFSPSVASKLTRLKEFSIVECEGMREIIEEGEQEITDGISFPELSVLCLQGLPSLTSFWCFRSGKANTCKVPLRLLKLSSIVLKDLPALKSFFHGANFEFHIPALKKVKIETCVLSTLFTFSMFRRFQLENLEVRNCKLLEDIVEDLRGDETCDKIITLSQLTAVALAKLPNLKSFFHNANYEFHLPVIKKVIVLDCGLSNSLFTRSAFKNLKQLEELSVCDCKLLESFFDDARADETLDMSDKIITLNQVSKVDLQGLPKFKSIFYGATYQFHMPALKNVKIIGCVISVLFTCSVFRDIQQLEELHVSDCESLEHIVKEVGGDETSEINGQSIKSPKLLSINLDSLPNTKSFSCTSSYVFYMPKLKNFRLFKCPRMEYLSSSKTNTSVVHVTIDWCTEEGIQDLDDYIRQNYKRGSNLSDHAGESSYSSQDPVLEYRRRRASGNVTETDSLV